LQSPWLAYGVHGRAPPRRGAVDADRPSLALCLGTRRREESMGFREMTMIDVREVYGPRGTADLSPSRVAVL
jgi:hypothetical protein